MWSKIRIWIVITFLGFVFIVSGLIINFIQLCVYLTVGKLSKDLFRRINYYLIYSSWSQIVALTEWWSGTTCRLITADEDTLKNFSKEHALVVMNHKYDIDWLMCWLMCDKLNMLGSAKTFSKSSLKKVPVIGWGWIFAEMIFLERNWERDSLVMGQKLDELMKYKETVLILLFCEGTRFTPEKHRASMEYARQKNFPELKYHLLPRTKGFNYCVQHLKNKTNAIYDIEIAFPETPKPTMLNILFGHKLIGDMYVRRIPIQEIPTDSDEECSKWLHELYQQKDKIMEEYLKTGKFPGKYTEFSRRPYPIINIIFWSLVVGTPLVYGLWLMLTSGNTIIIMAAWTVVITIMTGVYLLVRVTKADKGSAYGKTSPTTALPTMNDPIKLKVNEASSTMETIPETSEDQENLSIPNGHLNIKNKMENL